MSRSILPKDTLVRHKNILPLCAPGVVEYLSNGGVADNHKDFKELRYNECLTNFSCNGKNGTSDGSITHSFQLKSAYDSNVMPYTNYTYDFKVDNRFLWILYINGLSD